ncbi:torsin-1A-like [Branchiostoma floridae]|uniref:Torsin n=1 Tax=Branchiostoma floridae TaxID=7739 RepID=C3Z7Y3_BRAFL|nr:torsin-1A-like [Branchiostoma floridae]|eukprot:XP_002595285.1 hypothetical protein BRAFLDRAFT_128102 [Branchiostoma floridae]
MIMSSYIKLFFVLNIFLTVSLAIEPITTGLAVGVGVTASALLAGFNHFKCNVVECCDNNWFIPNITGLRTSLQDKLHGQHLVVDTVAKAVKGHIRNKNPSKALVLSFHGWTGGGKNFVSKMIAENLFVKGMMSRHVHLFVATLHFPHKDRVETYKDQLREWIKGNTSDCPHSIFVFDEMDKLPEGLLDAVKPYIDHYTEINGVDYRKTIFILLSNTAGNTITQRTYQHWQEGRKREDISLKEMDDLILKGSFNEKGGLWHSSLIEKNLIDVFIPFLPLERQHVKLCIRDDLRAKGHTVTEDVVTKVADELQYFPDREQLYSKSGCKRVSQKVDLIMEEVSQTVEEIMR